MADLSVLAVTIDRLSREWTPVSEALPKGGMLVLAWNGEPHLATRYLKFEVEAYVEGDSEDLTECDEANVCWMREGWYEQMECEQARANGWDVWVERITEPPVTHWMLLPAPPKADIPWADRS